MKIKTSELTMLALDWAVATCDGMTIEIRPAGACGRPLYVLAAEQGYTPWVWAPSTSWHHGGPIIERELINVSLSSTAPWMAWFYDGIEMVGLTDGPTPLIAAMRCYVASKLGDEVEIPEELA